MYQKILDEIKQDYYEQNFSNDGQRFVAWYLRNIHFRDMNETRDDITDGADDKQIDAIFIDEDKNTIYVIQGKFIGSKSVDAEPLREVLSSWIQLKDLVRLQEVANEKLKRKLSEVAKALEDDYEITFELITTSSLTPSAQLDLATFQETLAEMSERDDFHSSLLLVDNDEIKRRYDIVLGQENPTINHIIDLNGSKVLDAVIAGTNAIIAAVQLKECIKIPGIKNGTLFQKNVRQSLGISNTVNKGIKSTIMGDKHKEFFFFHNGITAICKKMNLVDNKLELFGFQVVNGCQSLNTILSCSEKIKTLEDTYILFRFYEIPQTERADKISINTNSQSVVKPRDLRSNDKRVLNLKKVFEQKYPHGYFVTKRGEQAPAEKDKKYVIDLAEIGKYFMAWHSQRPNMSYSETRIFDKYFESLFKRDRDYKPVDIQALNFWNQEIQKVWTKENPMGLNESLLAMRAYAPYHHLFAISMCFGVMNNKTDRVPIPSKTIERAKEFNQIEQIVKIAGKCINTALKSASNKQQPENRVFSPQNWIKNKTCLDGITAAIDQYFDMLPTIEGAGSNYEILKKALSLNQEDFEYRWAAD